MIEFQNTTVRFKDGKQKVTAVRDASFQINKGEIFGIAGSSGAGKSTLLRTINLLQPVTSGNVIVGGKDIISYKGKALREYRRKVGMIFQHFHLAENLTVFQNVAFPLRAAGFSKEEVSKKVAEYLSLVGLTEKTYVYPSQLSGGQKQRVAIARALINDAEILLCDEPTSALDAETTDAILELLRHLNSTLGITIVLITHELEVIKQLCTRCAVMDDGAVIEIREVYELFTNPREGFTKQLTQNTGQFKLPEQVLDKGHTLRLVFQGETADSPVISEASIRYGVGFNILFGRIEYIGGKPLGVLYVNPTGEDDKVEEAIQFLSDTIYKVEVIENGGI